MKITAINIKLKQSHNLFLAYVNKLTETDYEYTIDNK